VGIFRLFLALSVLLGHTRGHGFFGLSFVYPEIAVQSFFMISGFYMALVLNEKYNQPGQYKMFLQQRFLRLYPTYFILCVTAVVIDSCVWAITGHAWGSLRFWNDYWHLLTPAGAAYLIFENFIIFGQDLVMLFRIDPVTGVFHVLWHNNTVKPVSGVLFLLIGTSWSLAVEFSFYVLAPLLVRRSVRVQLVLLAICFLIRAVVFETIPYDAYHWIYCLFLPNLYFFMAGSLSYVIYRNHAARLRQVATAKPWLFLIFVVLALDYCRFPYTRQLYLIWMPLVFIAVPTLFALTCRSKFDRLIGELSYPCYLIHAHVLMLMIPLLSAPKLQWMIGPLSIVITLVLSYLFYRYIELKTERYRESLYKKQRIADPKAAAIAPPATLPILDYTNKPS
jgi:peptidoglycan/LPS O-acetylase OafA/YrhL